MTLEEIITRLRKRSDQAQADLSALRKETNGKIRGGVSEVEPLEFMAQRIVELLQAEPKLQERVLALLAKRPTPVAPG